VILTVDEHGYITREYRFSWYFMYGPPDWRVRFYWP
jgi:hypothetical protein